MFLSWGFLPTCFRYPPEPFRQAVVFAERLALHRRVFDAKACLAPNPGFVLGISLSFYASLVGFWGRGRTVVIYDLSPALRTFYCRRGRCPFPAAEETPLHVCPPLLMNPTTMLPNLHLLVAKSTPHLGLLCPRQQPGGGGLRGAGHPAVKLSLFIFVLWVSAEAFKQNPQVAVGRGVVRFQAYCLPVFRLGL